MGTIKTSVENTGQGATIQGTKVVRGTLTMGTYETSGDSLNLANYFLDSSTPTMMIGGDDGYVLQPTVGRNAEAMLVMAYYVSNINAATGPLGEVANATNLTGVNVDFVAFGQPY